MSKQRKAFFVTHSLGDGGSERVTVTVANYLADQGWTVKLVPLVLKRQDYPVNDDVILDLGVQQGGQRILRGVRKLLHVVRSIRTFAPDVVVSLGAGYGYIILARFFQRFSLVTSVRNDPAFIFDKKPGRRLSYAIAMRLSTRIVFQTPGAAEYFGSANRRKAEIISNPLRDGLEPSELMFSERDKEIVTFGRLVPQKRLDVLIEAFAKFHESHPDYRLSVFGRGPDRSRIEQIVKDLEMTESVSISDFRPDIHARIKDSAMYVSSSDVEGVSNAMLEAMAIGLPSACTDCPPGGSREVIEQFGTGVLADVGDPKSLAAAMRQIVESPEDADRMIENGAVLRDTYAREAICEHWEQTITQALLATRY